MKSLDQTTIRRGVLFDVAVITALACFFCLFRLGAWSFGDGDQTTHSKVVQEMVYSGDWWNPTNAGVPYYNKPPLKMWMVATIVSLFGETNFIYRSIDGTAG
ncbi:MAG: hypothetical protein IT290_11925, partial [Deltaproteobacteria bacterium]|nr:hypothetical protein [Deltaproteobacteria bacterium]